jgi:hypothetical protein
MLRFPAVEFVAFGRVQAQLEALTKENRENHGACCWR